MLHSASGSEEEAKGCEGVLTGVACSVGAVGGTALYQDFFFLEALGWGGFSMLCWRQLESLPQVEALAMD